MQFDLTVNMTFEVDDAEWKAFLEDEYEGVEEDEAIFDGAELRFLEYNLDGEEVQTYQGRAWVCSITDGSIM